MGTYFAKGRGYRFDFYYRGHRYTSPRGWPSKKDCKEAEAELRRRLRRIDAGLEVAVSLSPRWSEIAGSYVQFMSGRGRDIETVERTLRVVLRFFGAKPKTDPVEGEPYHDLRLQDVIADPHWILRFEEWMQERGIKGATKNRYRSACSRLYWFAMLPQMRGLSHITSNPFRGLLRDDERPRTVTLSLLELRAVIAAAPPWLQLAMAIAVYAPKLRLGNILSLTWDQVAGSVILVPEHKTARRTGRPMVAPVSAPLRALLDRARTHAQGRYVIQRGGEPVSDRANINRALRAACTAADVVYGRSAGGATFHTIRHSAATMLAQLGVPDAIRKDVMGHLAIQTTAGYTHLRPEHEVQPLEALAKALRIDDVVK